MLRIDRRSLQSFDWLFLSLVGLLILLGMVNLLSATHASAGEGLPPAIRRQLYSLGVATAGLVVLLVFDYRRLERLAIPIYAATLFLLAITLVVAPVTRGSQSWIFWGSLRFQPSELAKIGLILALARHFHRHPPGELRQLRDLWMPGLITALPVGLIVLQRDMGVALLTFLIGSTYLAFVRIPLRAWTRVALVGVVALAAMWAFALAPHQQKRILDFVDPGRDPLASGYQAMQSTIAVGSGGLIGKGYMEGTQTQLRFLPTQHTDFVFSVLAEEWGLLGSAVVLALYAAMLAWGLMIARNSKETFGTMLAVGCVGVIFWPAVINIAMVLGLAPVIGVPLPFFSYGGSALLASMLAIALLLNVSMRRYMF